MKKAFEKLKRWFKESNRWKHLAGGVAVGLGANTFYCAAYAGLGVAGALELKDKLWGGKWDWTDFALTAAGAIVGHAIRWGAWKWLAI